MKMNVAQQFHEPVSHVAGRDIKIRNFVVVPPAQGAITEAEEQRRFFEDTGISCCRDAREFYLMVLEDGRFSVTDLRHAIQQGSIRWDFGATQPTLHAFLFGVFCTGIMMVAKKYILEPRRVAIRVREWMSTKGVS